jgi:acetyl esterase/lipase
MSDILTRDPPVKGERVQYGLDPLQFAELRFPSGKGPFPLLFVIHGGWWLSANDLNHIGHLCVKFTSYGVVTCSLEYRRIGDAGGGWPGTFLDVANAIEYFKDRLTRDLRVDTKRIAVIGHSAGGHLALWLGAKHRIPKSSTLFTGRGKWLVAAISLAGVADLHTAWELRLGDGAVDKLIGGGPDQYPERYAEASPLELLPTGLKCVLIHGRADESVPISQSERFAERAKLAGDETSLVTLEDIGHFELIDPESRAWDAVTHSTLRALGVEANGSMFPP